MAEYFYSGSPICRMAICAVMMRNHQFCEIHFFQQHIQSSSLQILSILWLSLFEKRKWPNGTRFRWCYVVEVSMHALNYNDAELQPFVHESHLNRHENNRTNSPRPRNCDVDTWLEQSGRTAKNNPYCRLLCIVSYSLSLWPTFILLSNALTT